MRFLHSMVRVKDLDASLKFYCDLLGLKEARRSDYPDWKCTLVYLEANPGEGQIELTYNWESDGYEGGPNFGHLAFEVENVYDACQKFIDAGVTINRPPRDGWMAFLKSPDGISIELLQKGERLEPCSPWTEMENIGSW